MYNIYRHKHNHNMARLKKKYFNQIDVKFDK